MSQSLFHQEVEGMPLRIEAPSPQVKIVIEAIEVKREVLPLEAFSLPEGFKASK